MLSKLRSTLVCTFALLGVYGLHAQSFSNPYHIPTASDPVSVVVGDVNGDGLPDILWGEAPIAPVTSSTPAVLHVLLAQAGGGYAPGPSLSLPPFSTGECLLADFNQDHHLDLACTTHYQTNASILVFLGNGDGTFQSPITTAVNTDANSDDYPVPLIDSVGDLNGDGFPDLIEEDGESQQTQVLLGDGHGGFKPGIPIQPGVNGGLPTAADVNGDGIPDLLFPVGPSVELGNGDGTFGQPTSYAAASYYDATCIFHDMEGDGHLDAVCGYSETNDGDITGATDLIILHGNPDGSFNTTPISDKTFGDYNTEFDGDGTFQTPVYVADVNGDGILDVLGNSGDGLAVLLGAPGLTFSTPLHYAQAVVGYGFGMVYSVYQSQILDVNGDGIPDIVAAGPNGIYITYGQKNGSFASAFAPEVTEVIGYPTVADFNGDGIPDIAATGDTAIKLSLGKGDGTFGTPTALPNNNGAIDFSTPLSATNAHILHGDFNGDGKLDLLAIGSPGIYQYNSYILFGNGDGTFNAPILVPNSSVLFPMYAQLTDSAVFDINHDGRSDLLSSSTTTNSSGSEAQIFFALSNGDGSFRNVSTTVPSDVQNGTYAYLTFPALADFNRDGNLDAVYGSVTNAYVVNGHGDGTFDTTSTPLPIPTISGQASQETLAVATGDFDGDGNQDFVILVQYGTGQFPYPSPLATAAWVFYGNGNGTFSAPVLAGTFDRNYTGIAAADLNNDGLADLILQTSGSLGGGYAVGILNSQSGRTFGPEINYTAGTGLSSLAITDLNNDGLPDLVFGNGDYNVRASSVTVLLNKESGGGTLPATAILTAVPTSSTFGNPVTLTATVSATNPPGPSTPTGAVTFSYTDATTPGSTTLGTVTLTSGVAVLVTTVLPVGNDNLNCTYSGSSIYSPANCTSLPLTGAGTAITLTSSANPAPALTPITFTAQVPAGSGGAIVFAINGQNITTTPNAAGTATYTISTLTAGSYPITATWFAANSALTAQASLTQIVTAPAPTPDFFLTGSSITFPFDHSATGDLQLASLNGFTGNVAITCNPPFPPNYTCSLQFSSIPLTSKLTETFTYTLHSSYTASAAHSRPFDRSTRIVLASLFPLTLLSLSGFARRRRTPLRTLLTLTLLAILASATAACGPDQFIPITTGTYPITFTATGTNQGSTTPITHTLTINAIITP